MATRKSLTTPKKRKAKPAPRKKVVVAKQPRKKKLRLTVLELRLLQFPPTESTWMCQEEVCTNIINNGTSVRCWICGTEKGENPKLLYPIYAAACAKVGIEPGAMWRIQDKMADRVVYRAPKGSWKLMELPEGFTL